MTHHDDELRSLFAGVRFPDEPLSARSVAEDVAQVRRTYLRRRLTAWGATALGIAVLATGAAVAVPTLGNGNAGDVPVADATKADDPAPTTAADDATGPGPAAVDLNTCPVEPPAAVPDEDPMTSIGFANTRHCLLETAVKHFDPEWTHLQKESDNGQSGSAGDGYRVGTKLAWTNPGEDGMGLVQVAVTTPGYADGEYAEAEMAGAAGCELIELCRVEDVAATGDRVLVASADSSRHLLFGVMHQRDDGSFAVVAIYDLFGNNSLVPVSEMPITLEQAISFVTDAELRVDRDEARDVARGQAADAEAERLREAAVPDYSNGELIAAPAVRDMTDEELGTGLRECVDSVPEWGGFQPDFGLWIATPSGAEEPNVIAVLGESKLHCQPGFGVSRFGTPEVKGSPYLRGPVSYESMTFGRFVTDVDLVTVQPAGGPAYAAAMKNGYWFLPEELAVGDAAIRGYDADGTLVYDSTTVDIDQCYTSPDGSEVVYHRGDEVPSGDECMPALEWDH